MAPRKTAKVPAMTSPRLTRIYAIANNKGGVGKTTTAMNLAGAFVLQNRKVLAIDLDPQCNASIAFNVIVDANSPGSDISSRENVINSLSASMTAVLFATLFPLILT